MKTKPQKVGVVSAQVVSLLQLPMTAGQAILMGDSNIAHMKSRHPADYARYGQYIPQILSQPDYVGLNPKDGSIEYVKEFQVFGEYVKVAVRVSARGQLFARSVYCLNQNRVKNFIARGTLKKV